MDIEKLTPGKWVAWRHKDRRGSAALQETGGIVSESGPVGLIFGDHAVFLDPDFAEFVVLSYSDLGVKLRRGWHTERREDGRWCVRQLWERFMTTSFLQHDIRICFQEFHDVGLLTKADQWYRENIERGGQ